METFFNQLGQFKKQSLGEIPSIERSNTFIMDLMEFLFPVMSEKEKDYDARQAYTKLSHELEYLLNSMGIVPGESIISCNEFMTSLPAIYDLLKQDAKAIYDGDPAARSIQEVIITYPGFLAISIHRIAHKLYQLQIPLLPRIFSEYAHQRTGIDIHPGAKIGHHFCIDHGTGIVIGETSVIGNHVKIYQGVTLGALSVNKRFCHSHRHPYIEDYVTIYAGATILGGGTRIGHHSIIGGNAWITKSVAAYSRVIQNSQITITNKKTENNETKQYNGTYREYSDGKD